MNKHIHYIHASPTPLIAGTDALHNEVTLLQKHFGGQISTIYPWKTPKDWYPPRLYGLHKIQKLKQIDQQVDVHHVFAASLYNMPLLRVLKKPIIYSVVGGIPINNRIDRKRIHNLKKIIVSNPMDYDLLLSAGLPNGTMIEPGLELTHDKIPVHQFDEGPFTLMMASSPWTKKQFHTKGIHLLIDLVKHMPDIRVILLWRDVLSDEMQKLIHKHDVARQIELINKKVNIADYFKKAHVTILLSKDRLNVKAYPHSLIESLYFQRPVIMTRDIPFSQLVRKHLAGIVIDDFSLSSLMSAVLKVKENYPAFAERTKQFPDHLYSVDHYLTKMRAIYDAVESDTL